MNKLTATYFASAVGGVTLLAAVMLSSVLSAQTLPSPTDDRRSQENELRKRAENDSDAAAARELARRLQERGDPGNYAGRYTQLAEWIVFAAQSTAMPNAPVASRSVGATEPSYEELRKATRDMESCYALAIKAERANLPWDGELGWRPLDFRGATDILIGHGSYRPDFSKYQRFNVRPAGLALEISRQLDRAFPAPAGIPDAMAKCRARFNQLRPMFKSYSIDPSLRDKCIRAFANERFRLLSQFDGASKFELFAISPDGISHSDMITRPDKVRMTFAYYATKHNMTASGRNAYWAYSSLAGGCPTKP